MRHHFLMIVCLSIIFSALVVVLALKAKIKTKKH